MNNELKPRILSVNNERHMLYGYDEIKDESIAMATQAKRQICIFTQQLEHRIYANQDFVKAVKQLAIRHPKTIIRILLRDNTAARKKGHRLIYLAQHLSSSFQIKKIHPEFAEVIRGFMLVDQVGYVFRPRWYDPKTAFSSFNDPLSVKEYQYQFDKIWGKSELDRELRQL